MAIDTRSIEFHIREIIKALGDDPEREGLIDTPKRVAKMYAEVFDGMNYTNKEIAEMYNKTFQDDPDSYHSSSDLVIVKDIEAFSYCEHHMALMYNMKVSVAYIPNGKVIGLSKIARIVEGYETSPASGAHRRGRCGDHADDYRFRRRRSDHRREPQLYDGPRNTETVGQDQNDHAQGQV